MYTLKPVEEQYPELIGLRPREKLRSTTFPLEVEEQYPELIGLRLLLI